MPPAGRSRTRGSEARLVEEAGERQATFGQLVRLYLSGAHPRPDAFRPGCRPGRRPRPGDIPPRLRASRTVRSLPPVWPLAVPDRSQSGPGPPPRPVGGGSGASCSRSPDASPLPIRHTPIRGGTDLQQEVQRVIEQLPEQFRIVLVLRDLENFSTSEIAAILERTEATIRWRLGEAHAVRGNLGETPKRGSS